MANALAIVVSWALGRILLSLGLFRHMYLHRSELSLIDRPGAGCDRPGALSQHRAVRLGQTAGDIWSWHKLAGFGSRFCAKCTASKVVP